MSAFAYPAAGHGFNCDDRDSYHPAAAQTALERTLAWVSQYVEGQPPIALKNAGAYAQQKAEKKKKKAGGDRPRTADGLIGREEERPPAMLPTTILIDEAPRCVVRPTDSKDLSRFIRSGRSYLLAERPDGRISYRSASESESARWQSALALHMAWGGADEEFFGTPL